MSWEAFDLAIYRIDKKDNYVVLDKGFLNDKTLSWQAKGLMAYMLSLPNDWRFHMNDLKNRSRNGRDATYTIMKELIDAGYVVRQENREDGKFGNVDYVVHETKRPPHPENPDTVEPFPGKPDTGKPDTGNPYPENPTLLNNNYTKYTNTNNDDDKGSAFRYYEQHVNPMLSPIDIEVLNYWLDRFPENVVIRAIEKALEQNVRKLKYIERILMRWEQNKVKTLEDVERLDRQFEIEKEMRLKGGGARNGQPGNQKIYKHSRGNGGSEKESRRKTSEFYKPGKWADEDISTEGLI